MSPPPPFAHQLASVRKPRPKDSELAFGRVFTDHMALCDYEVERGWHDPTNIGNPIEFTVRQLATEVLRLTGARGPIVERPLPVDDPKVRQPDISRARSMLGWEPAVSLEEGLRMTIDYFKRLGTG